VINSLPLFEEELFTREFIVMSPDQVFSIEFPGILDESPETVTLEISSGFDSSIMHLDHQILTF
jgi:hypothetical protein